jgi:hypothetical protein
VKSIEFPDQDENEQVRESRELWLQARTLGDACELTASYLEGVVAFFPGHFDAIDTETGPIAAELAQINRLGLWTQESQPGASSEAERQREFLHGLCDESTAKKLEDLSNRTDLVTLSFLPGTSSFGQIPATASPDRGASLRLGQSLSLYQPESDALQVLLEHTTRDLAIVAIDLWEVQIFDPIWGRTGLLFPSVIETLTVN